jgi:hypothetical protein
MTFNDIKKHWFYDYDKKIKALCREEVLSILCKACPWLVYEARIEAYNFYNGTSFRYVEEDEIAQSKIGDYLVLYKEYNGLEVSKIYTVIKEIISE